MYKKRREQLGKQLSNGEIAIFFSGHSPKSTADTVYRFREDKNFFYLTGIGREEFILVLKKWNGTFEEILFIEEPNHDVEKWVGKKMTAQEATDVSGIQTVKYTNAFSTYLNSLLTTNRVQAVMLDLDRYRWNDTLSHQEKFAKELVEKYPFITIKGAQSYLAEMRLIKSSEEIETIREAIAITHRGIRAIIAAAKPDVYQYQLEAEFLYSIKKDGAEREAFDTIVASGEDGTILHYVSNHKRVTDGSLVLLDLGSQKNQYASDISRTFPINGKFTERQKEIYCIVHKAHDEVLDIMKPGTHFSELNKRAIEVLTDGLMEIGLIKKPEEISNYYYHGCSHYMGLDVHDVGERDTVLRPGMVLTIEPGLYIAEEAIGIRLEDDVLITAQGNEVLSKEIPIKWEDIEALYKETHE